jgi:hypothetical protein
MTDITITNIESAYLSGVARYERWRTAFEAKFNAPHIETLTAITARKISKMPKEVQNISRQKNPKEWESVDNYLQEVNNNAKKLER